VQEEQIGKMRLISRGNSRWMDPELTNRQRVFAEAMREKPSEIMVREALGEALSSRFRNRRFMRAFQNTRQIGIAEKVASIGEHRTDYPNWAYRLATEKHPVGCEGRHDAYWVEVAKNGDGARQYGPMLVAEAKGVAIAEKRLFSLRFSDALVQIASALDSVAPESTINVNYHLSRDDGKPHEIAEVLLYGNGEMDYGILKICIGDVVWERKGWLGEKREISGTLFLVLEEKALENAVRLANASRKFERWLDAVFNRMEGLLREIAPPGIADRLEIYRCLKQVQL
jgi:hypothetical protein